MVCGGYVLEPSRTGGELCLSLPPHNLRSPPASPYAPPVWLGLAWFSLGWYAQAPSPHTCRLKSRPSMPHLATQPPSPTRTHTHMPPSSRSLLPPPSPPNLQVEVSAQHAPLGQVVAQPAQVHAHRGAAGALQLAAVQSLLRQPVGGVGVGGGWVGGGCRYQPKPNPTQGGR